MSPDEIRARYQAIREERRTGVTIVAATKYVSRRGHGRSRRGGDRGRGREPRPGPRRQARRPRRRVPMALHRPPAEPQGEGRQRDLRARALARLGVRRAAARRSRRSSRSTSPGEPTKSGVPPEQLAEFLDLYPDVRGLMTMPPQADDPEASRPYFRRLRELAEAHGLDRAVDGHEPGLPRRRRGGRDATCGVGSVALRARRRGFRAARVTICAAHGLRRPLEPDARLLRHRRGGGLLGRGRLLDERGARAHLQRARPNVRRLPRRRRASRVRRLERLRLGPRAEPTAPRSSSPIRASTAPASAREPARPPSPRPPPRGRAEPERPRPPRPPAQLQRRPADRRQVQGRRSR